MYQSSTMTDDSGDNASDDGSGSGGEYSEKPVEKMTFESKPGTIYSDIDVDAASFIVASNPLTKTHTWHPMPNNSIMWYTRGSYPELRSLRKHQRTKSFILSKTWRKSRYQIEGNLFAEDDDDDDDDDDDEEEEKEI
jgi:hypothetical protein